MPLGLSTNPAGHGTDHRVAADVAPRRPGHAVLRLGDGRRRRSSPGAARGPPWPTLAWLAVFFVIGAYAVRGVAWWPLGAVAAIAGVLVTSRSRTRPTRSRSARRSCAGSTSSSPGSSSSRASPCCPSGARRARARGAARASSAMAPPGITAALRDLARPGDHVSTRSRGAPGSSSRCRTSRSRIDSRIELFPASVWDAYEGVIAGVDGWQAQLDAWDVAFVVVAAPEEAFAARLAAAAGARSTPTPTAPSSQSRAGREPLEEGRSARLRARHRRTDRLDDEMRAQWDEARRGRTGCCEAPLHRNTRRSNQRRSGIHMVVAEHEAPLGRHEYVIPCLSSASAVRRPSATRQTGIAGGSDRKSGPAGSTVGLRHRSTRGPSRRLAIPRAYPQPVNCDGSTKANNTRAIMIPICAGRDPRVSASGNNEGDGQRGDEQQAVDEEAVERVQLVPLVHHPNQGQRRRDTNQPVVVATKRRLLIEVPFTTAIGPTSTERDRRITTIGATTTNSQPRSAGQYVARNAP